MPLPEIQNNNFDVSVPIKNYLDIRGKQAQNSMLEQAPAFKQQELQNDSAKIEGATMARRANVIKMALDASKTDPAAGEQIFNELSPEDAGKFRLEKFQDNVKLTLPDGSEITGSPELLSDMYKSQSENPDLWKDQKMVNASMAHIIANGGDFKAAGQPKSIQEMIADAARPEAEKRTGQDKVDYLTGIQKAGQKGNSMTVNFPAEKAFTELGKAQAEDFVKVEKPKAETAVESLANINRAISLIDGGIITGPGADFLTKAGAFLKDRMGIHLADDLIANTQAYQAFMGREVGAVITLFGSGTGLSDADREYAEAIAGGNIALTEESLRTLLEINRGMAQRRIDGYNEKAGQIWGSAKGKQSMIYDPRIKAPPNRRSKKSEELVKKQMATLHKKQYLDTYKGEAPAKAVEALKDDPGLRDDFMEAYGYIPVGL